MTFGSEIVNPICGRFLIFAIDLRTAFEMLIFWAYRNYISFANIAAGYLPIAHSLSKNYFESK